jgi:hypothetical protein
MIFNLLFLVAHVVLAAPMFPSDWSPDCKHSYSLNLIDKPRGSVSSSATSSPTHNAENHNLGRISTINLPGTGGTSGKLLIPDQIEELPQTQQFSIAGPARAAYAQHPSAYATQPQSPYLTEPVRAYAPHPQSPAIDISARNPPPSAPVEFNPQVVDHVKNLMELGGFDRE